MKYVYLLQSVEFPDETYVGLTDDLRSRFTAHNTGRSPHTAKYKPWRLVTYVAFSDERKAVEFERYLKSASGRAFPRSAYASRNWRLDSKTKVRRGGDRAWLLTCGQRQKDALKRCARGPPTSSALPRGSRRACSSA